MTDRATIAFWDELTKEAKDVGGRYRVTAPADAIQPKRDEGEVHQGKVTSRENQGTLGFNATPDLQKLRDKRHKKYTSQAVGIESPDSLKSTWRSDDMEVLAADEYNEERKFLLAPDTNPIHLANEMSGAYGSSWVSWEPETLWETIRKDWKTYPNEESKNKLMALKVLLSNDYFWQEWEVFEKICVAFNDRLPEFQFMDELSMAEIALAVALAAKIKKRTFKHEVQAYVASVAHEDGYVMLPTMLTFAQEHLDTLMQGTPGEDIRDKLKGLDPVKLDITSGEDPVHVQAGYLQAVAVYLKLKDTHNAISIL
jgi:hypothetical protein